MNQNHVKDSRLKKSADWEHLPCGPAGREVLLCTRGKVPFINHAPNSARKFIHSQNFTILREHGLNLLARWVFVLLCNAKKEREHTSKSILMTMGFNQSASRMQNKAALVRAAIPLLSSQAGSARVFGQGAPAGWGPGEAISCSTSPWGAGCSWTSQPAPLAAAPTAWQVQKPRDRPRWTPPHF